MEEDTVVGLVFGEIPFAEKPDVVTPEWVRSLRLWGKKPCAEGLEWALVYVGDGMPWHDAMEGARGAGVYADWAEQVLGFHGYGGGDGYGLGDGYGYGLGDGSGYGSGFGSGFGVGSGDGDGDGDGSGVGSGYGSGYGYGDQTQKRRIK